MKRVIYTTAVVALAVMSVLAASALAGSAVRSVPFKATYAGKATEKVDGQAVTALAKGAGSATVLGKSTIVGTVAGTTANPPCSPIAGPGTIKSAKGNLKVNVNARGCAASEQDQNNITVSGTVKVKGGTGKYRKAKGSFHFSGRYNRSSGAFNVKLTGKLTY